jgi:hypothetical protein
MPSGWDKKVRSKISKSRREILGGFSVFGGGSDFTAGHADGVEARVLTRRIEEIAGETPATTPD